jgi:hypothetical protein
MFDQQTIERNQKMIGEWSKECSDYKECGIMMITMDDKNTFRFFKSEGLPNELLKTVLSQLLEQLK